jgi:cytochrome c-type biogenesis protein CcmH
MSHRSITRYSGRRASLDPMRSLRVCRRISAWCLVAAIGIGSALLVAAVYDPDALDRIQDQAPLQRSPLERARAEAPHDLDIGVAALAARLERAPDDVDGWALLARSYLTMGDNAAASDASLRVAALRARDPGHLAREAETRIAIAGGVVEPDARRLVDATLALDPSDVRARFFRGLAEAQADRLEMWFALEADAAPDAPWLDGLRANIERLTEEVEVDAATLAALREAATARRQAAGR